jgi:hypothetical protein
MEITYKIGKGSFISEYKDAFKHDFFNEIEKGDLIYHIEQIKDSESSNIFFNSDRTKLRIIPDTLKNNYDFSVGFVLIKIIAKNKISNEIVFDSINTLIDNENEHLGVVHNHLQDFIESFSKIFYEISSDYYLMMKQINFTLIERIQKDKVFYDFLKNEL